MFKFAMTEGRIVIDNPAIWRPLIDIRDTAAAFHQAINAPEAISGVFNVAFDNFTVGQVGELVKEAVERLTGKSVALVVNHREDYRNYRVTCDKARAVLGFAPQYSIQHIVESLHEHLAEFGDFSEDRFYNMKVFAKLDRARM
jgi:nucleoside-diphosphate-sugar epimerase